MAWTTDTSTSTQTPTSFSYEAREKHNIKALVTHLFEVADLLHEVESTKEVIEELTEEISSLLGTSTQYPAALAKALRNNGGDPELAEELEKLAQVYTALAHFDADRLFRALLRSVAGRCRP